MAAKLQHASPLRCVLAIGILALMTLAQGCVHRASSEAGPFVSVAIGHTASDGGTTWVVDGSRIRIQGGPESRPIVFYEAELLPGDRARILAALNTPEVARLRGQRVTMSANPDGIVLSDFAYVQVALKRDAEEKDAILFVGQVTDVPLSLLPLIDSLFPAEYRFIRKIPSAKKNPMHGTFPNSTTTAIDTAVTLHPPLRTRDCSLPRSA